MLDAPGVNCGCGEEDFWIDRGDPDDVGQIEGHEPDSSGLDTEATCDTCGTRGEWNYASTA